MLVYIKNDINYTTFINYIISISQGFFMKNNNKQQGFTLVELSIVLVIIGLIVSGILVGQDMIRAAEIRSTVSQIESYNTAVNTFRDKYRNIPGDMLSTDATNFGFLGGRVGGVGDGDGNRLVQAGSTPADQMKLGFETGLFWRDLSKASLIGNDFVTAANSLSPAVNAAQVKAWLPEASIGRGHYFTIHSESGRNFFSISQVNGAAAGGIYTLATAMTPQTAFNIDDKIDDGNPLSGIVNATWSVTALGTVIVPPISGTGTLETATLDMGSCAYRVAAAPSPAIYTTASDAQANRPACQLRIRASF